MAELSVRFARLAGGSAIVWVDVGGGLIARGGELEVLTQQAAGRRNYWPRCLDTLNRWRVSQGVRLHSGATHESTQKRKNGRS